MKKLIPVMLFLSALFTLYAGGGKEKSSVPQSVESGTAQPAPAVQTPPAPPPNPYFTGDGGKGVSLAILAPQAVGLAENQKYLPSLVQGELVSNFFGYSAISVLDRVNLDEQYGELLSGYYDDDAEAGMDLGHLTPTEYIMGGSITKTAAGYALQIRITKTADKMTAASYSGTCTFAELDNLSGIRQASLDLLQKMGVTLTEKARTELAGAAAQNHVSAQTALAQGITSQKSGTVVESLAYYFQAVNYDPSLAEAASRVNILSASISSGNMGEDVRNDIQWRKQWVDRLTEAEAFYANYVKQITPYYLIYSANLQQGNIDYASETVTIGGVTVDLAADYAWIDTPAKVVNTVRNGLLATKRAEEWGLNWPTTSVAANTPFVSRYARFTVAVELVNEDGKTIGSERITLPGGWRISHGSSGMYMTRIGHGPQPLTFYRVNANLITDRLTVKIKTIDGVDAETAAKAKGINILTEAQYTLLPDAQTRSRDKFVSAFETAYKRTGMNSEHITNEIVITGYAGPGGALVIPPIIFGDPVTFIGEHAFSGKGLTSVVIPNSVKEIDWGAFQNNQLTSVVIPDGLREIDRYVFSGNRLTSVVIPNSVEEIDWYAFSGNQLTSVVIPSKFIREGAFSRNPLTSITIREYVSLTMQSFEHVGDFEAFYTRNGYKAGTYTRPNANSSNWTYRP